jgi:hypothetical protein
VFAIKIFFDRQKSVMARLLAQVTQPNQKYD